MRGRLLLFLSFFLLAGLLWIVAREWSIPTSQVATSPSTLEVSQPEPLESPSGPEDGREPAAFSNRSLQGSVRSAAGRSIQGARVIWLALREGEAVSTPHWAVRGQNELDRPGGEAETDSAGRFEIGCSQERPYGFVLLAFHPEHCPGGIDRVESSDEQPLEIVLEPAAPITVSVVDPAGGPLSGATVRHAALPRSPRAGEPPLQAHERFFAQEGVTGSDGRIKLPPFRGEQVLWAEKGDLISVPWQGIQPSEVVLRLGESFTLGGSVTLPIGRGDLAHGSEPRILVSGLNGNLWRQLACLRNVREGSWGPLRVPLDTIARYTVRLEGAHIIPIEESFDSPRGYTHRRIDFAAQSGGELILTVEDESKNPIPTAQAEARGNPSETWSQCVTGRAGVDGVIRLGALSPGLVRYVVSAPGYAIEDSWEIEVVDTTRANVTLRKGGSIAGRCVHGGQPVTDFEVIYWHAGNISIFHNKTFLGRADGRFEIDGLSSGDWFLHAASPVHPSGPPRTITVQADRAAEVELELPNAIRGGGRILAANTGDPVAGAHVQPFSSGGLHRSLPWGPGVLTAEDGSFDLDAFTSGLNYITVEAEGFALAEAESNATDEDFLDWGEIRLVRPQSLQVSLVGLEALNGVGPEDFRSGTEEGYILPEKRFDSEGVVRYDDVPPGDMRFIVSHPDGSWARLQLRLDPGKDWNLDLKVAGDRRLEVHATDSIGQPLPYVPNVMVGAHEETGILVVRMTEAVDGSATFEGIRAARVQVFILDRDFNFVASQDVAFGSDSSKSIEMRVGEQPLRVHVLDTDRAPIPGASVTIRSVEGAEIHGVGKTNADGWADLVGLPSGPLLMDVQHGVVGRRFGVPIDASAKELEFVLEATASLELDLLDGDEPLAGVLTRIQTTAGVTLGDARQTDDQGRVRYESLGEGNYLLACHREDCWPSTIDRKLAPGEQARVQVQMRRLADLEFTLFSADGLPVSGVEVELTSQEFDVPVATWIEEERVRAPDGLTTDGRGTVRVEGLPRGSYSWSLSAGGQDLSGTFELAPAKTNQVRAFLQAQ